MRDRSVSPLRYINLPVSKLARVTEELENLINPTTSIVHAGQEEENEEQADSNKKSETSIQQEESTETKTIEPKESIVLSQVITPITTETQDNNKLNAITHEVSY